MPRLAAFGLAVDLPAGWEGRARRRTPEPGATALPILHAASFPLPAERGDYGGGAVELMSADDVFVTLFEHDPAAAGSPLFARPGRPLRLPPEDFQPNALQRVLPGQSGLQSFFTEDGRAFCLYVVLGSHVRRFVLAPRAEAIVRSLAIGAGS
ncbi:MAG: hypothetical protein QOK43_2534 [Acidimicrobiaceae bacterium]|nr:hypothetical protein [Acidimicrobiaceae bacterium]MDQ1444193.1 hypothetical protein [Acidimicrobiaceae bacterium]